MSDESFVTNADEEVSRKERINSLHEKHSRLEQALNEENDRPMPDAGIVKEIKHQKLAIKDEILKLNSQ